MSVLQRYITEMKPLNDEWSPICVSWRRKFLDDYPRDKIESLPIEQFLFAKKGFGNPESFCVRLWNNPICSLGNSFPSIFGIYIANGTELKLSSTFSKIYTDYDDAFQEIKKEIVTLLRAGETKNLEGIAINKLSSSFKCLILMTYFEKDYFPAPTRTALDAYCKAVNMSFDEKEDPIYRNVRLVELLRKIPEISDWSTRDLMAFCDWLWRKGLNITSP